MFFQKLTQEEKCSKNYGMLNNTSNTQVFMWRMLLNKMTTIERLCCIGVVLNHNKYGCSFWNIVEEIIYHLFFRCEIIVSIWLQVFILINLEKIMSEEGLKHYYAFYDRMMGIGTNKIKGLFWLATMWNIWSLRNELVFKRGKVYTTTLVREIKLMSREWFMYKVNRRVSCEAGKWISNPISCLCSKTKGST